MDAVGFEPTIIGTYACGLEYLTHISMNYTEPDQRTLILINNILYFKCLRVVIFMMTFIT